MNAASTASLAWVVAAGVALLAGLWLLRRGWRGRSVGDEPFCSKCGYNLKGLPGDRCPECGADVSKPKGVRLGVRLRRRKTIVLGATASIAAVMFLSNVGWRWAQTYDWYHLKPTGYVLDDLDQPDMLDQPNYGRPGRSKSGQLAIRAWNEIDRRERNGSGLAQRHRDRLVRMALAKMALITDEGPTLAESLMNWLGQQAIVGRLSDEQKRMFMEAWGRYDLTMRPVVVEGTPVSYYIEIKKVGPVGGPWRTRYTYVSATVDGREPQSLGDGWASGGGIGLNDSRAGFVKVNGVGKHEVTLVIRMDIFSGRTRSPYEEIKDSVLQYTYNIRLHSMVDIVANTPDRRVQTVQVTPEAAGNARYWLTPLDFAIHRGPPGRLSGHFWVRGAPLDFAFVVAARIAGKEYPLGAIASPAAVEDSLEIDAPYNGPTDLRTIDLILRPDPDAAQRSGNLARIWGGAVELKNVRSWVGHSYALTDVADKLGFEKAGRTGSILFSKAA